MVVLDHQVRGGGGWRVCPENPRKVTKAQSSHSLVLKKSSVNVILGKDLRLRPAEYKFVKNCRQKRREDE